MTPLVKTAPAETAVACRAVGDGAERALHLRIRRRVFVEEQGLFEGTDRDAHDDDPATIHVLGFCGGVPAGAVRLYRMDELGIWPRTEPRMDAGAEPGLWKGDRLAVLAPFRNHGLGAPLVRFAVRAAAEAGGRVMVAHIQPANVAFFEHLGWNRVGGPVIFVGHPHQMMMIDLAGTSGTSQP